MIQNGIIVLFFIEILIKTYSLGCGIFFKDYGNILDFVVVMVGMTIYAIIKAVDK